MTRKTAKRRRKRPQNPHFEKDSLAGLSWTRVQSDKFPHLRDCLCCDGKARVNDMVITVPLLRDDECVGTSVVHAFCLRILLEEVPEDIKVVRAKVNRIRELFVEVS